MATRQESAEDSMIPKGCDQQGRHPEAAEAATEVGADDGLETVGQMTLLAVIIVVIVAVISLLAGYFS